MDAELIAKGAGLVAALAGGYVTKNCTPLPHKELGPAQNVLVGAATSVVGSLLGVEGLTARDAVEVAATAEMVFHGAKSIGRFFRRFF